MIQTKGKSTLIGQTGKLIAFGFAEHPILENSFIEVVLYQTKREYVICMSEGPLAGVPLPNRANVQRTGLGSSVPGAAFAPYAARSLEGKLPYEEFKKVMNDSMPASLPGIQMEWYR